jgi:membrane-associated protein
VVPGWVQLLGAASMSAGGGANWWEYLLLFLAVMASWAGVPAVGSAALGAAAVGASQGNLNLAAIIVIAAIAGEIGGLIGYRIGFRWGSQLLDRPGKRQAGRQKLKDKGELAYAEWGRLAVFFTPAIISGTARMHYRQFVLWNFVASIAFALSVAATSYGLGRVATGHHSTKDFAILVFGLALSGLIVAMFVRRHRRHNSNAVR